MRHRFAIPSALLTGMLSVAVATTASAQAPAAESPAARTGQYVFVIDDSGSMAKRVDGQAAADPDRLAVFAVRSLVTMLDGSDEVSLVRLNGPRDGQTPPPVEPLSRNRAEILARLADSAPLAAYGGEVTPCRSALDATAELLEAAYRPNVSQVVMLLTDGACTPNDQVPELDRFLARLRSHRDGLFQLYLLRFRGRRYTAALERLAEATGGQSIEVTGEDPTAILEPFADALTRSQGYEAEVLDPGAPEIAAHRGAKRVRLLAVAEGAGPSLGFVISDRRGRPPELLGDVHRGDHQYGRDGRIFRFATVDYRPGTEPVRIDVTGASRGWKVVAVPEYRLFARLTLHQGDCESRGPEVRGSVETGSSVCAVVTLENEQGEVVDADGSGGGVEAAIRFHGVEEHDARAVPMNRAGSAARFTYPYRNLPSERFVIEPLVRLRLAGRDESLALRAPAQSLQVTSLEVTPEPASLDFGALRPGDRPPGRAIAFHGNFPATPARLEVADRADVPSCVTFALGGDAEGAPVEILEGQMYSLEVRVDPYCGPHSLPGRLIDTHLRLAFDTGPGGHRLPTVTLPTRLTLDYRIEVPTDLALELVAGEDATATVAVRGNQTRPLELRAVVPSAVERRRWPEEELELLVAAGGDDAGAGESAALTFDPAAGRPARLDVRLGSGACCAGGSYATRVGLVPRSGVWGGPPPAPIVIPVTAVVRGSGVWACRGPLLLKLIGLLLLLLLVAYLVNMVRNSRFLSRDRLAEVLVPLRWGGMGAAEPVTKAKPEVRDLVRRALPWRERALVWLRSNPLKFGLPGGAYNETVELVLVPSKQVGRSQVRLVPGRRFLEHLQAHPEEAAGRLFARAEPGAITFFGVPRNGSRLGRLDSERLAAAGADPGAKPRLVRLRRERLIDPSDRREPGSAAGWQINRPRVS